MAVRLNPYLQFRGIAREAMTFYQEVFGGELTFSTYAEFGLAQDPADAELVMHSQLVIDGEAWLMGADAPAAMPLPEASSISIAAFGGPEDEASMRAQWSKLAEGGQVLEQLAAAPWGDVFGMVVDRFGTLWQLNIAGVQAE